ncbi:hypothetical protein SAMN05444410_106108 [Hydrobacter penzbergensis]|uniref:Uncharacterized protein n=1 Tax=Hydrobacter penzbergensis TaxID=1235997 RepID=A0A8X8LE78_9BACT|nr:hypothetical protein [Hydrobacter penzbergensis]SDW84308.1 hypothetical protein SAMN05444410_106108 [Hydrobacter penzbergensis]
MPTVLDYNIDTKQVNRTDSIPVHKPGFISRIVGSYKARAKSIARGLAEAEKIKNGQKKVKSFEQAIKDL